MNSDVAEVYTRNTIVKAVRSFKANSARADFLRKSMLATTKQIDNATCTNAPLGLPASL